MKIEHIVFYGTLKLDGDTVLHESMSKKLEYLSKCVFPGNLYDLGRYPGLKLGKKPVQGELYKILDASILDEIDPYEAKDNLDPSKAGFTRISIDLLKPKVIAWVYQYDGQVNESDIITRNRWR